MLLRILYTGQPHRPQEQRTEAIPGKEPVCEPSNFVYWHLTPLPPCPPSCALNQLLIWGRGLDILLLFLLTLTLPDPRSFLPQKLTVWMWSCMGAVR